MNAAELAARLDTTVLGHHHWCSKAMHGEFCDCGVADARIAIAESVAMIRLLAAAVRDAEMNGTGQAWYYRHAAAVEAAK